VAGEQSEMSSPDRIAVLEKAYMDLVSERNRLRDARASFTARLGPLPASAAIAIGLVGSAGSKVNPLWIVEAAALLAAIVLISTVYSGLRPYRLIRGELQPEYEPQGPGNPGRPDPEGERFAFGVDVEKPALWLEKKIELEGKICGRLSTEQRFSLALHVTNLQDALDVERSASMLVQILFVELIFVLAAGIAMRDVIFAVQIGVGGGIALVTLGALLLVWRTRAQTYPLRP
jgi:hypothetical protein